MESASALDIAATRSPFAERVWREAARRRFCQAPRTAVLGDGAPWIWNIAEDQFPLAIQIVDRFHAKQHLSELAKALYGPTTPRASHWAERRKEELDTGKFRALLTAIRRQISRSEEARRGLHYFQTNRHRMRYPEFHAQGLCTSTGVVEAGCKVAIGTRLKRAGMHWTVHGSSAVHRPPLCPTQRALSGLLGTPNGTEGRMTHHFLVVHPRRIAGESKPCTAWD